MIVLEVSLNGKVIANAGRNDLCVLNTIVNAVGVLGGESSGTKNRKDDCDLFLSVGGLSSEKEDNPGEHVRWAEHQELSIGDMVSVRVIESNEADNPKILKMANVTNEKELREHWEMAREYYLKHRDKYESDAC